LLSKKSNVGTVVLIENTMISERELIEEKCFFAAVLLAPIVNQLVP